MLVYNVPPAPYPVQPQNRVLQKYLQWTPELLEKAKDAAPKGPFMGVHARMGSDWVFTCKHAVGRPQFFASPQCKPQPKLGDKITSAVCFPAQEDMAEQVTAQL